MVLHRRWTGQLLAGLVALLAFGFGATARADAAPTQPINAAQRGNAMRVLADGTAAVATSAYLIPANVPIHLQPMDVWLVRRGR
jgi:hypothetical protein